MRKLLAIIAMGLLFGVFANAQISLSGGWQKTQTISTTVAEDGYRSYLYAWADGFYVGATSRYSLPVKGLSADWSIFYSFATGTESDMLKIMNDPHYEAAKKGEVINDEHYISVPATLRITGKLAEGLSVYAFAGAEVAYCLSSKSYSSWAGLDGTNHWNVDHFAPETNYNGYTRFDAGVLGGAGVEILNRVRLEFGADYGLLDRSKTADDLLHRFSLRIGLSFLFR